MIILSEVENSNLELQHYGDEFVKKQQILGENIKVLQSFVFSINDTINSDILTESVEKIGDFPVSIDVHSSLKSDAVSRQVAKKISNEPVNSISELKEKIAEIYDIFTEEVLFTKASKSSDIVSISVSKVPYSRYKGVSYSVNPFTGNENEFYVELMKKYTSETDDQIAHSYRISHHTHKVLSSSIGTGYLDFSDDVIQQLAHITIKIQKIMKHPFKMSFFIDFNGFIIVDKVTKMIPGNLSGNYSGLISTSFLWVNTKNDAISPLINSFISKSLSNTCKKLFYHKTPGRYIPSSDIRFSRCYLKPERDVFINKSVSKSFASLFAEMMEMTEDAFSIKVRKYLFTKGSKRIPMRSTIHRVLTEFNQNVRSFCDDEVKYSAFRENVSSQPHRKLEKSASDLITYYYLPVLESHFSLLFAEFLIKYRLFQLTKKHGAFYSYKQLIKYLYDRDPDDCFFQMFHKLCHAMDEMGKNSHDYLEIKTQFLSKYFYIADNGFDLNNDRWGDSFEMVEKLIETAGSPFHLMEASQAKDFVGVIDKTIVNGNFISNRINRKLIKYNFDLFKRVCTARKYSTELLAKATYALKPFVEELGDNYCMLGLIEKKEDILLFDYSTLKSVIKTNTVTPAIIEKLTVNDFLYTGSKEYYSPRYFSQTSPVKPGSAGTYTSDKSIDCEPIADGIVTGKVRIVKKFDDLMFLSRDSILVMHSFDPSYRVALPFIKGVILEQAYPDSTIVSDCIRYGIPSVSNVNNIYSFFHDEEEIEINTDLNKIKKL